MEKPTYEELANAYQQLLMQFDQLQMQINQYRSDRTTDRLKTMMEIIKDKKYYSDESVKLAEWHMENILQKPKKQ